MTENNQLEESMPNKIAPPNCRESTRIEQNVLIIAGVHKAGTTSLYSYLAKHPNISSSKRKETHFFSNALRGSICPSAESYLSEFSNPKGVLCEADPEYIYGKSELANYIKLLAPQAKLVFILREQKDKLYSNYKHQIKTLAIDKSTTFSQFLTNCQDVNTHFDANLITEGCYYTYLLPWFEVFKKENIRIIFFEELKLNPLELTSSLLEWVGLDPVPILNQDYNIQNRSVAPKNKVLHQIAYSIYKKNESLIRNSRLLLLVKNIYFKINTIDFKNNNMREIEKEIPEFVIKLYNEENRNLNIFLTKIGYKNIPEWLK